MYVTRAAHWPDPRVKPPFGAVVLNQGDPLARGLVNLFLLNEGGGNPVDLVTGRPGVLTTLIPGTTVTPSWKAALPGRVLDFSGNNGAQLQITVENVPTQAMGTFAVHFTLRTLALWRPLLLRTGGVGLLTSGAAGNPFTFAW